MLGSSHQATIEVTEQAKQEVGVGSLHSQPQDSGLSMNRDGRVFKKFGLALLDCCSISSRQLTYRDCLSYYYPLSQTK